MPGEGTEHSPLLRGYFIVITSKNVPESKKWAAWLGTEVFFSKAEIKLFPTTKCPEGTLIRQCCPPTGKAGDAVVCDRDFAAGWESTSRHAPCDRCACW